MKLNIPKENLIKGGVYIINSTISNDSYIGSTGNFKRRYWQHIFDFNGKKRKGLLTDFVNKNGHDCLIMRVLLICDNNTKKDTEYELIQKLNPSLNIFRGVSAQTRRGNIRRTFGKTGWTGQHHTEDEKQKISNSMVKKPVQMMDIKGNIIETFNSILDVRRKYNYGTSHISSCCKGERNTAYGYKWAYLL